MERDRAERFPPAKTHIRERYAFLGRTSWRSQTSPQPTTTTDLQLVSPLPGGETGIPGQRVCFASVRQTHTCRWCGKPNTGTTDGVGRKTAGLGKLAGRRDTKNVRGISGRPTRNYRSPILWLPQQSCGYSKAGSCRSKSSSFQRVFACAANVPFSAAVRQKPRLNSKLEYKPNFDATPTLPA